MELLDYTEEDLEKLDTETLLKLIEECEDKVKIYLSQQMSKKILINSLYGALANKGFSLFNEKIAQSITGNGRFFIQYSAIKIENKLQSILPSKNKYLVYGDTDSCVGDTIIETIRSKTKIEDFFNHTAGKVQVTPNGLIKKPYMNLLVKSMSDKFEVEFKTVKYIMKHSVEKRMFKIKTHEREVIITEDHSVIVNRNGEMLSVKPKDILKTDKLIFIGYFDDYDLSAEERKIFEQTTDFEIEDLGIQKQTVYDIEVEDNHNFFGNDILLHNSNYYHIGNIMAEIIKKNPNKTINEYVDLAIKFEEQFVDPTIQESIKEFAEMFNAHDVGAIGAKRELVADKCLFVAKKKYVARVRDKEGVRFPEDEPYPKVMGLDIARSAMPSWCKNKLKHESIDIILDKTEKELKEWIDACKKEFINQPISEICSYGTVSRIDYSLTDKGIPFMCKAGIYYNKFIKEHNLDNKYTPIENDTSVKLMRLKTPNKFGTDLIAYIQDTFVDEFINDIDYDTQFNKSFVDAINNMTKVLHYDLYNKFDCIDEW